MTQCTVSLVFFRTSTHQPPACLCSGCNLECALREALRQLSSCRNREAGAEQGRTLLGRQRSPHPDTVLLPSTYHALPQESQCAAGTCRRGKVLTTHLLSCSTADTAFHSSLPDPRPHGPNSTSAESSDGKIMPEYRKLSIKLSIWKNQAHNKTKWTLKIRGPFILLHLKFLVCQMSARVPLNLRADCTDTSVKCRWRKLLIIFGGECRYCSASRAWGHTFQQQNKTNCWIAAYQRRAAASTPNEGGKKGAREHMTPENKHFMEMEVCCSAPHKEWPFHPFHFLNLDGF